MSRRRKSTQTQAQANAPVKARFLEHVAEGATIRAACEAAGIGRATAYFWRGEDEAFRAAWDAALEEGADRLEEEARRRAVEGTSEPVFHQGVVVGHVRKYSDTLLIFMLKGARPEKYRERYDARVQGSVGVGVTYVSAYAEPKQKIEEGDG